jgi:hypothetical protein
MSGVDGDIEARLAEAAEAMREHDLTAGRCVELRARAEELQRQIVALQDGYDGERRDVRRLEGVSLARVVSALRGSREDDLARERAEADAAGYRVVEAQARLAAVQRDESAAQARLDELTDAPTTYAAVLDEKEALLSRSGDPRATRLLELADERGRLLAETREVGEAIAAAQRATNALAAVARELGTASGWSTYDTFFGGGALSSAIKHSRMDEAAIAARHADECLLALRTELADVADLGVTAPQLATDGLTRFVDIWFDNIFTDLAVRDRIRQAQENVARCTEVAAGVESRLYIRDADARARLAEIETERQALLTPS